MLGNVWPALDALGLHRAGDGEEIPIVWRKKKKEVVCLCLRRK